MAKKTFKDNPALQFITAADGSEEAAEDQSRAAAQQITEQPPAGYRLNPLYVELKTKRLQLVIPPSTYTELKAAAAAAGISANEYCNRAIKAAILKDKGE